MQIEHDIDTLIERLQQGEVRFCFMKIGGELREARGTLNLSLIPSSDWPKGKRKPSPQVLTFWDTDKMAWRCLRRERLAAVFIE